MLRRWLLIATLGVATPSLAYRPFDSTDADTAAPHEIEIEAGTSQASAGGAHTWSIPAFTFNYGLEGGREVVLDLNYEREELATGESRSTLEDLAVSFKQVLRRGSMQGEPGVSIATELAVLAPLHSSDRGVGAECALIASRAWQPVSLHANVALAYERTHEWAQAYSLIVEGPGEWRVRPVLELLSEHAAHEATESGVLVGAIWEAGEHWAVDAALRRTRNGDERGHEWRAGFTWTN